jgi:peptide deformylase
MITAAARRLPALLILSLGACAGPAALGPARPTLQPVEHWLVQRGGMHAAMELVTQQDAAGEALLRTPALPVDPDDATLWHLEARLLSTVQAEGGVGIAAPQVGIPRRVILVQRLDLPGEPFQAFRNPRLVSADGAQEVGWEGCLSVPGVRAQVRRARAVEVEHALPGGETARVRVEGFTARIFQHELDHLDGVLYLERREPDSLIDEAEYQARKARGEIPPRR